MEVGVVGLSSSGRTTVFRALMAHAAQTGSARSSVAPIGVIRVPDSRLERLAERFKPRKKTPVELRIHDLCPSLEPTFPTVELEAMKRMDALLLVVPGFADPSPEAATRGLASLVGELCLEDLAAVERRLERARLEKLEENAQRALVRARELLEDESPLTQAELTETERRELRGYALITDRPLLAVYNVAEAQAGQPVPEDLAQRGAAYGVPVLAICAALEAEMAELPADERADFLAEYGVDEPAGGAVTRAVLDRASVIAFFTVGEDECRAWPIERGTRAREAAGKIHSDMQRGFIRAEVIDADSLDALPGGLVEARKKGLLRLEGKDYVVREGEVVHFRFNV